MPCALEYHVNYRAGRLILYWQILPARILSAVRANRALCLTCHLPRPLGNIGLVVYIVWSWNVQILHIRSIVVWCIGYEFVHYWNTSRPRTLTLTFPLSRRLRMDLRKSHKRRTRRIGYHAGGRLDEEGKAFLTRKGYSFDGNKPLNLAQTEFAIVTLVDYRLYSECREEPTARHEPSR